MSDSTIVIPFAENGDKQTIPQSAQPSGTVSYDQGYTPNYSDPGASQYVERTGLNESLHTLFTHAKYVQDSGFDKYRNDIQYSINSFVWHNGNVWQKVLPSQSEPSSSSPWVAVKINNLAPKDSPTFTGLVTVPLSSSAEHAVNNNRMASYVSSQFGSTSVVFNGQVVTYPASDNSTKPASTAWVRSQNYAKTNDVSVLSNNAMTGNLTPVLVPVAIGSNDGYGVNNIFPDKLSKKSEIKRVRYLVSSSGDVHVPGQSENYTIAVRFASPVDTGDTIAIGMEFGREAQFVRFHSQLNSDTLTNNRAYSQTYAVLSKTRQEPITDQVATVKTVSDTETSILRLIKNFIAKTPAEFDRYNNDARFQLVSASQNKNLRFVTNKSQVGTTIGSDDAVLIGHTHNITRVVGSRTYPQDGFGEYSKTPQNGTSNFGPLMGRIVTSSVAGGTETGIGKNIPSSFCVAMFEFIG